MIQQSHFGVYTQRKLNRYLKEISAPLCLLQHYLQYSSHGNNPSVHRWMNGHRRCGMYTMKYYSAIKRRKSCHLQQHGWAVRALG